MQIYLINSGTNGKPKLTPPCSGPMNVMHAANPINMGVHNSTTKPWYSFYLKKWNLPIKSFQTTFHKPKVSSISEISRDDKRTWTKIVLIFVVMFKVIFTIYVTLKFIWHFTACPNFWSKYRAKVLFSCEKAFRRKYWFINNFLFWRSRCLALYLNWWKSFPYERKVPTHIGQMPP